MGGDIGHKQTAGCAEHLDSNLSAGRGPHPTPFGSLFVLFFFFYYYYYFYYYYEVSFLLSGKKANELFVLMNKRLTTEQL